MDDDVRPHAGCYAPAERSVVFDRLISGAGTMTEARDRAAAGLIDATGSGGTT